MSKYEVGHWAIYRKYKSYSAAQITAETPQKIRVGENLDKYGTLTEMFKDYVLGVVSAKESAATVVEKLKSAEAECNRRSREANIWFQKRREEIMAEAASVEKE